GTGQWEEIGQSVRAITVDSGQPYVFHGIAGDSILVLGTLFGLYTSTDQGNTWEDANSDIRPLNFYSLVKSNNGQAFLSNHRGIYQGILGDTNWTKRYPTLGYMNGCALFMDKEGQLYTLGAARSSGFTNIQPLTYKSNDGGATWEPDTAGISALPQQAWKFYVDAAGTQFAALYGNNGAIYVKPAGGSWA